MLQFVLSYSLYQATVCIKLSVCIKLQSVLSYSLY